MHPDYARASYALSQRPTQAELRREDHAAQLHAARPHRSRWWTLNWTMLSPRDVASARPGRSTWAIIISASRPN